MVKPITLALHIQFSDAWRWFIISYFFLSSSFNVDVWGLIDDDEYIPPQRDTDTVGGRCRPQHAPETFCSIDSSVGGGCTIWSSRWTRHYWAINIQSVPAISLFAVLIFPFFFLSLATQIEAIGLQLNFYYLLSILGPVLSEGKQ